MAFCQRLLASPARGMKAALPTQAVKTIRLPLDDLLLDELATNTILDTICAKSYTRVLCKLEDTFLVISFCGKWRHCLQAARLAWKHLTNYKNTHFSGLCSESKKNDYSATPWPTAL